MKKLTLIFLIGTLFFTKVLAQNGYDWGANKPEAKAQWQYLNFLVDQKNYNQAVTPLQWLLKNTPNLHESLYVLGTKVYQEVEKEEVNRDYRKALQDTVLMLYDKRIELFGNEAEVMNRKGVVAFPYLVKRKDMTDSIFGIYDRIYELNGNKTYITNAYLYMTAACDRKKFGGLENEDLLGVYEKVLKVFDYNIKNEPNEKKKASLEKYKSKVDTKLGQCADLSCDYAIEKWGASESIDKMKLVYNILLSSDCTNKKEFTELASKILEQEPSASGYRQVGDALLKNGDYKGAVSNYLKAIEQTSDLEYQAGLYVKIADIYSKRDKVQSRVYAKKAIAVGQYTKEAHLIIANLYLSSYEECQSDNPVISRSVFIAAANEYMMSGNASKAAELKANFPSKEEVFLYQKKVGDKIDTGCWVNETVTIQTRD